MGLPGTTADFTLHDHRSIFVLVPLSVAARNWMAENVDTQDAMSWAGGIVVDHHCIEAIIGGAIGAGLEIQWLHGGWYR